MRTWPVAIGSALALCFACSTTPAITVLHLSPGEKPEAVQGDAVKYRRGTQENYVGMRPGFYIVRSNDDWRNAWASGETPAMPSTLDTSRSMLLLAIGDAKDTSELKLTHVVETGSIVHVFGRETKLGPGCQKNVDRDPFDAIVTPRIDKAVKFYIETDPGESCGDAPSPVVKCRIGDGREWTAKLTAQPGDPLDCEVNADARGRFAIVDRVLSIGELPPGSTAKLSYTKGSQRGHLTVDVFGTYAMRGEATDDSGRKGTSNATIEAVPPKTKDILVQLVWTNFDPGDDPETFPRLKLHAEDKLKRECSSDTPNKTLCEVQQRGAGTQMKLLASEKKFQISVAYLDEHVEKGPVACVNVFYEGHRVAEACDRKHRNADEKWVIGSIEGATGIMTDVAGNKMIVSDPSAPVPAAPATKDAGAPKDGGTPAKDAQR